LRLSRCKYNWGDYNRDKYNWDDYDWDDYDWDERASGRYDVTNGFLGFDLIRPHDRSEVGKGGLGLRVMWLCIC
jgi:hypothetical protein